MATDLPPEVRQLVEFQAGVLSRTQIIDAGLSGCIVNSRLRRGSWQQQYPGVYCTSSGEPSREARLWAAVLYAGRGAMLSYQTAAELWKLTDDPSSLIHLTIPADRRVRKQPGIVLHLSARAEQTIHPSRHPPRTRLEDTVIDLCDAAADIDTTVGWVTRAIGRRLTTPDLLRMALEARGRLRWRAELAELLSPDSAGIHSLLEYRYVRDVERPHRFPVPRRQAASQRNGRSQYRDAIYEEYQTAVELDGRTAHPGDTRWQDVHRDNAAATTGLTTLRYGWRDVTVTPCRVAAEVAAVLAIRGYSRAKPCSPACPVGREPAAGQDPGPGRPSRRSASRRRTPIRARRQPARAADRRPARRDSH